MKKENVGTFIKKKKNSGKIVWRLEEQEIVGNLSSIAGQSVNVKSVS